VLSLVKFIFANLVLVYLKNYILNNISCCIQNYEVILYLLSFLQSTPESLFVHHAQRNLLPSHTYSNNSGGDPLCIPDLTVSLRYRAITKTLTLFTSFEITNTENIKGQLFAKNSKLAQALSICLFFLLFELPLDDFMCSYKKFAHSAIINCDQKLV